MLNDFLLEIIATIVILSFFVAYLILKRSATSKRETPIPQKEEKKSDSTVTISVEEKTSVPEAKPAVIENRRKSDAIIPRREVPLHEKITKQHFSEFAGERILIAEDNPINQKVILGLLADSGIELIVANDGLEVLDILQNDRNFVMILMDANMPRMDGFEATRAIRSNPKYDHILIVALSGDIATDDVQKMKDAGMDEQLAKPLRMDALYKIIYAYTGQNTIEKVATANTAIGKNLNFDKGLETCGGDQGFYQEILTEFIDDYGNASDQLGIFLRAQNLHDADALLLDLIGVTENIGAHPLGEIASNLKRALKDTDEQSYFSIYDQFKLYHEKLIAEIRECL